MYSIQSIVHRELAGLQTGRHLPAFRVPWEHISLVKEKLLACLALRVLIPVERDWRI